MKDLIILGSTGSIGTQVLDVVRHNPRDFRVCALSANRNIRLLKTQIQEFHPDLVAVTDEERASDLRQQLQHEREVSITVLGGEEALEELCAQDAGDLVVNSLVGVVGIRPTLTAIGAGKDIALANKETLVAAGKLVMEAARQHGVRILPIDSEHSAIFQCLEGRNLRDVQRLLLTSSGGPFRTTPKEKLAHVTAKEALAHPTWNMGAKISIDSATMMNKGFEVLEAMYLFDVLLERIEVLIHPESIVHSLVEFVDHSVLAQLSVPDMRLPIQYALFYPHRRTNTLGALDLASVGTLTFDAVDEEKFPCLFLAYDAAQRGGTVPAVMNTANDILVARFLAGQVAFNDISAGIQEVMAKHRSSGDYSLQDVLDAIQWTQEELGAT